MTFDEILHWCIFRSPKRTAKSAAELVGVHPVQFGLWRNHTKSNKLPTDEQCLILADICELNPYTVWLAVQYERVKVEQIRNAIKVHLGGNVGTKGREKTAQ